MSQTYFAGAHNYIAGAHNYIARAEKRGGGEIRLVYLDIYSRNVISHVILLFSRDCHMIAITLSPE